jgi:DNA repair exonuclease SbcCD ATPase subunit
MTTICFEKIKMKNFVSVGNYWQEIDYTKAKNTLVTGTNGSGKSAIMLDAITYALFGRPNREINVGQLINSITNKDCVVEIEFKIGTDQYKVVRGQKPSIFEIYKNGTDFKDQGLVEIYKNGTDFKDQGLVKEEADKRDYQKTLEESILRMNLKTFKQVVIIGSATYKPLMQLKADERREVVEDILDIGVYTLMNEKAKAKAKALNLEIKSLDTEIGFRKEQEKTQRELIKSMEAEKKQREEEAEERIAEAEKEIEGEKKSISDIDINLEIIESDNSAIDSTTTEFDVQIDSVDGEFDAKIDSVNDKFDPQIEAIDVEIESIEIPTASSVYRDKIRVLQDSRTKLSKQLGKHEATIETEEEQIKFYQQADCPTCGQEITSGHRHTMNENSRAEITEAKVKLAETNELIEQFDEKVKKQQKEMDTIIENESRLAERKRKKESLILDKKREKESLTSEKQRKKDSLVAEKKRKLESLIIEKKREIASLKAERRQSEKNIERLVETISQWTGNIDSSALKKAKIEYKENAKKLEEMGEQKAEKQEELSFYEMAKLMLKDDGIKAQQIADDLPEINKLVNFYLSKFDLFISFELTPTFEEVIKARHRDTFSYSSFSEGQKRRVDHSLLFTMREIAMTKGSISCNLVMFDEILEKNLDEDGKDVLKDLIAAIDPAIHVFVISPIAFTEEFFDRKLMITYPNEFTKITEEMK